MSDKTPLNSERTFNNESSRCSKMAEGQESSKKINLTVKTPKEKQTIEVEENASIKDVCISICMCNLRL
jgi:hypothetical protein